VVAQHPLDLPAIGEQRRERAIRLLEDLGAAAIRAQPCTTPSWSSWSTARSDPAFTSPITSPG
jgi:hypothetical protein